jgi:hypothetical protein
MVWQCRDGDGGMVWNKATRVKSRGDPLPSEQGGTWTVLPICSLSTAIIHHNTHINTFSQRTDLLAHAISAHKDDIDTSFDKVRPRQSI